MNIAFWTRIHGGTTHFPIALVIASVVFDLAAHVVKKEPYQRDLRVSAFYALLLAALGAFGAVLSGLIISGWQTTGGSPALEKHHLFIWPAFGLIVALAVWRIVVRDTASKTAYSLYTFVALVTAGLVAAAGYWGGEMLLGAG